MAGHTIYSFLLLRTNKMPNSSYRHNHKKTAFTHVQEFYFKKQNNSKGNIGVTITFNFKTSEHATATYVILSYPLS